MGLKPPLVSPQSVISRLHWHSTTSSERQPLLRLTSGSLELDKVKHTLSLFCLLPTFPHNRPTDFNAISNMLFLFSKAKQTEPPHTHRAKQNTLLWPSEHEEAEGLLTAKTPRTTQPWCCRNVLPYALSWKEETLHEEQCHQNLMCYLHHVLNNVHSSIFL